MPSQDIINIIRLLWPVIVLQLALAIWAIVDIARRKKTRSLTPTIWIIICIFVNFVGPIAYILFGRAED